MAVYVDTSVLVAYYVPEPLSDQAEDLLRTAPGPVVSDLVEVELQSAIARKLRGGELEVTDAVRIRHLFASHLQKKLYRRLLPQTRHYRLAASWLRHLDVSLRALDSLHLAMASSEELRLLTADRRLAEVAEELSVEHVLVSERESG